MSSLVINPEDEQRLRELASGIAKDIEDLPALLKRTGFSMGDYEELCATRMFRTMLDGAYNEWLGAGNTQKRVRLKAAINIEQSLPHFYHAMTDKTEPLSSRVKVMELMMKAGNVGVAEPVAAGGGSAFNLTIQLNGDTRREMIISGSAIPMSPEEAVLQEDNSESYSQSELVAALPFEEF